MPAKQLAALALSVLPCASIAGELATFFDAHPYISLEFGSFTADVLGATMTESYSTRSNGHGIAELGPCSFGNTATGLSISSGGWHGAVDGPGGRAAGTLDCRMDFTFQLLDERGGSGLPPETMRRFYSIATHVSFDPAIEMARYGWDVSLYLTSLDSGRVYPRFGEGRYMTCGVEEYSPRIACQGSYDFNSAPQSGFKVGERVSGQLVMNLFYDLRRVPEPSSLLLLSAGGAMVAFRRKGRRRDPRLTS